MFSTLLVTLFAASSILASTDPFIKQCSSILSKEDLLTAEEKFKVDKALKESQCKACHTGPVNVYFHIIAASWLPYVFLYYSQFDSDTLIDSRMSILNESFAHTGLQWNLAGVDRAVNESWFNLVLNDNMTLSHEMKQQLKIGNESILNIYSIRSIFVQYSDGYSGYALGFTNFPWSYTDYPIDDGSVLNLNTFPGSTEREQTRQRTHHLIT
ncbi:hypothetical protein BDQ17DRAFT_1426718 [Cyathus striatus]|nr:hypothetical protein BDQ17DRAFT_1426718 [Cyathus striatus]